MNHIIISIFKANYSVFFVFGILLLLANRYLALEPIPITQIAVVTVLFGLYYIALYIIVWYELAGRLQERILATLSLIILLCTIEPILISLIYSLLPSCGIYMDKYMLKPGYEFNIFEFRQRWVSALVFLLFLIGMRLCWRSIKNHIRSGQELKRQVEAMQKNIEQLHDLLKAKQLNPHFMEKYVAIALGREMKLPARQNKEMILLLTDLMYYQLKMDDQKQDTTWNEERKQLDKLLEMARYGQAGFTVKLTDDIGGYLLRIPHGLLLMPLENALKYGINTLEKPLCIALRQGKGYLSISFSNFYDVRLRTLIRSTGTGFRLMKARIEGG